MKQEKEVMSDIMGLWVILRVENVHGRQCTMSMEFVHSFMRRRWKNSIDNVHSTLDIVPGFHGHFPHIPWVPWTLSTHSMDSMDNVYGFCGKCPGCPWNLWTFYRRAGVKFGHAPGVDSLRRLTMGKKLKNLLL